MRELPAEIGVLAVHARDVPAQARSDWATQIEGSLPRGSVLLSTCHRVEVFGNLAELSRLSGRAPSGARLVEQDTAVRHLVSVAVGRDSAVVGEDQILHQLRLAVRRTRQHGAIGGRLDRALDIALHAGRHARSWLPAQRPTLIDLALERVADRSLADGPVLVIGAGEMGQIAVGRLAALGARVSVASRTPDRARAAAARFGAATVALDPGAELLGRQRGVLVALSGEWQLSAESAAALTGTDAWLIDLSSPPALPRSVLATAGPRLVTIDDLADGSGAAHSASLLRRMDVLIEQAVAEYRAWAAGEARRAAAEALSERARRLRAAELDRLWRRVPMLDEEQRTEVERALEQLSERLLRDPIEQLAHDGDGRHARAARELFRL